MYYIIQENLFREEGFNSLIETLNKFQLEYEIVKFIPFIHEMNFKTTRKDVWCFGSVNMSQTSKKYNFVPGSMYNDNHDVEVYGKMYGENLLNHDGMVINFTDPIPDNYAYLFFARPTKDSKVFSGQVFTKDSWIEYVNECIKNKVSDRLTAETKVLIAPLKETQQEVRCWIVNGKVITASRYKLGRFVRYQNYDNETGFIEFAQQMVNLYSPAKAFVLDICLFNDEYKVVEVNCINCSGLYHGDMQKIIVSLEETFN